MRSARSRLTVVLDSGQRPGGRFENVPVSVVGGCSVTPLTTLRELRHIVRTRLGVAFEFDFLDSRGVAYPQRREEQLTAVSTLPTLCIARRPAAEEAPKVPDGPERESDSEEEEEGEEGEAEDEEDEEEDEDPSELVHAKQDEASPDVRTACVLSTMSVISSVPMQIKVFEQRNSSGPLRVMVWTTAQATNDCYKLVLAEKRLRRLFRSHEPLLRPENRLLLLSTMCSRLVLGTNRAGRPALRMKRPTRPVGAAAKVSRSAAPAAAATTTDADRVLAQLLKDVAGPKTPSKKTGGTRRAPRRKVVPSAPAPAPAAPVPPAEEPVSFDWTAERAQNRRERKKALNKRLYTTIHRESFDGDSAANASDFYSVGQVMGQGAFGKVLSVKHVLTNTKVAVKAYDKNRFRRDEDVAMLENEMEVIATLNHPHVIRHFESYEKAQHLNVVMEFASGGSLYGLVKRKKKLPEAELRPIARQLTQALAYLHRQGLVHRDVKMENVLFDECRNVKLADFGFCISTNKGGKALREYTGTIAYMAPEVVAKQRYGLAVDVWSLGVLFFAALTGYFPFGFSQDEFIHRRRLSQARAPTPPGTSPEFAQLMDAMLRTRPGDRLTMEGVWAHPWLTGGGPVPPHDVDLFEGAHAAVSKDVASDLRASVLDRVVEMGFRRRKVTQAVRARARNQFTTTYYLLLKKARLNLLRSASSTSPSSPSSGVPTGVPSGVPPGVPPGEAPEADPKSSAPSTSPPRPPLEANTSMPEIKV